MTTLKQAWDYQNCGADGEEEDAMCFVDLRRRVEALEALEQQRAEAALVEQPAEGEQLWKVMDRVFYDNGGQDHDDWVATINTVAERLEEHGYHDAGDFLRTEARRARGQ